MKNKYLIIGAVLLMATGWAARVAWRVHRQVVTLDVRNLPLREVLRKIEWQTWKTIRAEQALDVRITLHVTDKPLNQVLDRIAEQAGARWSTLYAVFGSNQGRKALEDALAGTGKIEAAGWTRLAPTVPEDFAEAGEEGFRSVSPQTPDPAGPPREHGPQMGAAPGPMMGGTMLFRRGPAGGVMLASNGNGQTELWSPTELVMESALCPRLAPHENPAPTAQAAAETARKLNVKWTTYLTFKKSVMGIGFVGPGRPGDPLRHGPNDRYANLTPEQRVQRAREQKSFRVVHFQGQ